MSIETPFLSFEEEYSVAGWVGTFGVMQTIANASDFQRKDLVGQNELVMQICKNARLDATDGLSVIRRWAETPTANGARESWMAELGIGRGGQLNPDFELAYAIDHEGEMRNWIIKETPFARLMDSIGFHSEHQSARLAGLEFKTISLSDEVRLARREIEYYVGYEDPGI